jgi:cytoskeleton protein RodZ
MIPLSPERVTDAAVAPAGEAMQPSEATGGDVAPPVPAAAPESRAARDSSVGMRMEMAFVGESWVEIRDGEGSLQFSGTVPAGSTRSFEVRPPVDVVVGNARAVRITYNEKPFDVAAHATRNIARFRLE